MVVVVVVVVAVGVTPLLSLFLELTMVILRSSRG